MLISHGFKKEYRRGSEHCKKQTKNFTLLALPEQKKFCI
jgi:hypothetical protein